MFFSNITLKINFMNIILNRLLELILLVQFISAHFDLQN